MHMRLSCSLSCGVSSSGLGIGLQRLRIEEALRRIDDGSYGYCEETGEPIALSRLEASPISTLSLEAQERHERRERVHRDD